MVYICILKISELLDIFKTARFKILKENKINILPNDLSPDKLLIRICPKKIKPE